ncbi:MAG: hypothetical protein EBV03_01935 [Proteobacteria bacterium]|nr:hypothetical protein [Pseudomonadota bacterium]
MASTAPAHWADYSTLSRMQPGDRIASPAASGMPYIASWPRRTHHADLFIDAMLGVNSPTPKEEQTGFYGLVRREDKNKGLSGEIKSSGWKFHISVHPEDVPLAWNSIAPYIQQENIGMAKVATAKTAAEHASATDVDTGLRNPQQGKMLVLYAAKTIDGKPGQTPQDWQRIINGVEKRLAEAGVRPGPEVLTDRAVPGSQYSYYRSSKMDKLLENAFREVRDANIEPVIDYFMKEAPRLMGSTFNGQDAAFDNALQHYIDNLPPREAVLLPRGQMRSIIKMQLASSGSGLNDADIEAVIPKVNAELDEIRFALLNLPPERRFKLPSEPDPYAALHIENPHILKAEQERKTKDRGIIERK